ncbi:hypothetical protein PG997_001078 [Apiospora hydei]|uniref:serine--tRNA ligase n=1 Tax=Apiospora hydei TaxID=1337664 RepID=A0ABR1XCU9_9PEZI
MASDPDARPTLAHRSVSNIRAGGQPSARDSTSGAPHTPLRPLSTSAFGSPSSARAEEEIIIIELGCRKLRVGFAGDSTPKRIVAFDSEHDKRAGDYRAWEPGYEHDWRKRMAGKAWGSDHELCQLDVRGQDLGLVGDKLERVLRDTFTRYLLVDSKPRRISLVLPPAAPLPLLSSTLSTLFRNFQIPTISLLSSPVMATFAAGVRSGLVVDIGWNETIVTAVYEFRQVRTWRTVRAGKKLLEETMNFLVNALQGRTAESQAEEAPTPKDILSFEECEEVATRMLWCKKSEKTPKQSKTEGLPTLHEADESDTPDPAEDSTATPIHLTSCKPSKTIEVPFSQLAEPCETTFFETRYAPACFDDHELPLHLLIYRGLLQLPLDEKGWEPIQGKGADAYRKNPKLKRNASRQTNDGPIPTISQTDPSGASGEEAVPLDPAHAPVDVDEVEEHIRQEKNYRTPVQGVLRVIDTLGPWCGASMATQLKVPALAMIERDIWLQQGVNGASRPHEVDVQAQQKQQRQSMGTGGLIRARFWSADHRPRPSIDIKHIRQNPTLYEQNCIERNYKAQSAYPAQINLLHQQWQEHQRDARHLRERSNLLRKQIANSATTTGDEDPATERLRSMSKDELLAEAKQLKEQLSTIEQAEDRLTREIEDMALASDRVWRSHVHIGSELGLLDFAGAATSTGWGWYYLLDQGARLEQALIQFALAVATRHGWRQVTPPSIVYGHIAAACGFQPRDQHGETQIYNLAQSAADRDRGKPDLVLAGTAEIPLAGMKADTLLEESELPLKRVGVSRCYRAEAGARGADTKGLYRVHEFNKVELFAWTEPNQSSTTELFDEIVDIQTEILEMLGLHCRILEMPSTDLGASAARKCDIEAFFPRAARRTRAGARSRAPASAPTTRRAASRPASRRTAR